MGFKPQITACLMNRFSTSIAVYGRLRKASEFWRRISRRDCFLWRNPPVSKVISSSVISHRSFSGIWNTCSVREDYLFPPKRFRMPFVQRTWPHFPTWGKTKGCLNQESIQWGFLVHPQSFVHSGNPDFRNDRRHHALVDNLFPNEMEIPVISHTHSGALRTVRRGKTLVGIIVHQVCDIVRNPLSFLWESPNKFSR